MSRPNNAPEDPFHVRPDIVKLVMEVVVLLLRYELHLQCIIEQELHVTHGTSPVRYRSPCPDVDAPRKIGARLRRRDAHPVGSWY